MIEVKIKIDTNNKNISQRTIEGEETTKAEMRLLIAELELAKRKILEILEEDEKNNSFEKIEKYKKWIIVKLTRNTIGHYTITGSPTQ